MGLSAIGASRKFNGSSDFVAVDGAVIGTSASAVFSVCGWLNGGAQSNRALYSESTSSGFWWLSCEQNAPNTHLRVNTTGGDIMLQSHAVILDNTWHHVLFIYNGLGVGTPWACYIDGVLDSSGTTVAGVGSSVFATFGALRRSSTGQFFQGSLAHWATWKRLLSGGEAIALGSGVSPLEFAPYHYWPLLGKAPEPDLGFLGRVYGLLNGTSINADIPARATYIPHHLVAHNVLFESASRIYVDTTTVNEFDTSNLSSMTDILITDPTIKYAQGFTPNVNAFMSSGSIFVTKRGSPIDALTIELWDDSGGIPNSALASVNPNLSSLIQDVEVEIPFVFSPPIGVTANQVYYIVTYRAGSLDNTNYYELGFNPASALGQAQKFS